MKQMDKQILRGVVRELEYFMQKTSKNKISIKRNKVKLIIDDIWEVVNRHARTTASTDET